MEDGQIVKAMGWVLISRTFVTARFSAMKWHQRWKPLASLHRTLGVSGWPHA